MYVLFFLIWILFNGHITVEIVLFGLVIAALLFLFMCKFMDYSLKKELLFWKRACWGIHYCVVLVLEIIKANYLCMLKLFTSRYELEPVVVSFDAELETKLGQVILANSITLTPGTITVNQEGTHFEVHCLDKELAEGLNSSVFVKEIKRMEAIQ